VRNFNSQILTRRALLEQERQAAGPSLDTRNLAASLAAAFQQQWGKGNGGGGN